MVSGTVLITGGTGTIGKRLSLMLQQNGYNVIILTRNTSDRQNTDTCRYALWNPGNSAIDPTAIPEADYIVNLAGAGIADKRWTSKRKQVIRNSRTAAGNLLVKSLSEIPNKVKAVISISGVGYYGSNRNADDRFTEATPSGNDFLASTCVAWENVVLPVTGLAKRLVILRTAVVLDHSGGAYREFAAPLKFRLATVLGSGRQLISWIHIEDMCRIILYALRNTDVNGVYNAAAPIPASNIELISQMAALRYGKGYLRIRVPAPVLKLALGQMANDALLKHAAVSSQKLLNAGFEFRFPTLYDALDDLNGKLNK